LRCFFVSRFKLFTVVVSSFLLLLSSMSHCDVLGSALCLKIDLGQVMPAAAAAEEAAEEEEEGGAAAAATSYIEADAGTVIVCCDGAEELDS
jgi:hypothetical protein